MKEHKGNLLTPKQDTVSIPEAIELNKEAVKSLKKGNFPLHAKAVMLGIEALKSIKVDRINRLPFRHVPLPGETPEKEEKG